MIRLWLIGERDVTRMNIEQNVARRSPKHLGDM
jgi:hypothetical protein